MVVLTVSPSALLLASAPRSKLLLAATVVALQVAPIMKTPRAKVRGVFFRLKLFAALALGHAWCLPAFAACPAPQTDEVVTIAHIYDGDTLRLRDGRRVRILGINAPEAAAKGRAAEPLAEAATRAARNFFAADKQARLAFDRERRDHYGRVLAHVYSMEGESLAGRLLGEGLAFHIVVPPNLSAADCLQQQAAHARLHNKGVWREHYWRARPAAGLQLTDTGFLRVSGTVKKVSVGRDIWLELDGPLVLKVAAADKHYFGSHPWDALSGKKVEVTGWVRNRSSDSTERKGFKPLQLQLRSPHALTLLPDAN